MKLPRLFFSPLLWRVLVVAWALVLYWLSDQSSLPAPVKFNGVDKLEHAVFFAAGGTCFLLGLRLAGMVKGTFEAIAITVLFCSVIGGLDEWHQTYTPGRSGGDVADWLADTVGGIIGAWIAIGLQSWLGRKQVEG